MGLYTRHGHDYFPCMTVVELTAPHWTSPVLWSCLVEVGDGSIWSYSYGTGFYLTDIQQFAEVQDVNFNIGELRRLRAIDYTQFILKGDSLALLDYTMALSYKLHHSEICERKLTPFLVGSSENLLFESPPYVHNIVNNKKYFVDPSTGTCVLTSYGLEWANRRKIKQLPFKHRIDGMSRSIDWMLADTISTSWLTLPTAPTLLSLHRRAHVVENKDKMFSLDSTVRRKSATVPAEPL
uniref:Uncharacterized protein n=1 Tax=Timema monikensis TaxID=170555 RepID=A0A7R9HMR8_9NEOP|nr:unnamed protein product [Timema monikensis]